MQASTGTPTNGHSGTIYVSIELSQRSWLVTMHSPDRDRMSRHSLAGGDHVGLLALLERICERVERKLGYRPKVVSCYEAGYDGFWLHRLLVAAGITNYVFDPASIAVEQRRRRSKTDRIDGEVLLAHADGLPARRAARGADRAGTDGGAGGCPAGEPRARSAGQGADRARQPDQGAAASYGNGGWSTAPE